VPGNGSNFGTATTITAGSSGSFGLLLFDLTQLTVGLAATVTGNPGISPGIAVNTSAGA
jgi:hypothetical protein